MNIAELSKQFAIDDVLQVTEGKGSLPFVEITNAHASATISLYGGQVLSYKKASQQTLLFLSNKAYYEEGKAIKGGVPICWPWFGNDPEGKGRPAHGFARNSLWQLANTQQLENGATKVVLKLSDNEKSLALWPYQFELELTVIVGEQLSLELTTKNTGDQAFRITQALHTYFSVQSVDDVSVEGLDQKNYLDKAKANSGAEEKVQSGDVIFDGEVDRVYLDVPHELRLKQASSHDVLIKTAHNKTAVVWNPWKALCEQSADLQPDDYRRFVCVETANAASDIVQLSAGEHFTLAAVYELHG